jgi:hypothetical protein
LGDALKRNRNVFKNCLIVRLKATIFNSRVLLIKKSFYLWPSGTQLNFIPGAGLTLFKIISGMPLPDFSCLLSAPWRKQFA